MVYADEMRKVLTGRAGDWVARHSWPHLAMIMAFALSAWAAYQCSFSIVSWGSFTLRFCINFLAAYVVFVLCLGLWLWNKPSLDQSALLTGAPDSIETKNPWDDDAIEAREQLVEHASRSAENNGRGQGVQGVIALAIVAMIVGTLFVAVHMIWYARWYLGYLLVLGGKISHRALGEVPTMLRLTAPLKLTVWPAVILLVHYALLGLLLQWAFPQAITVADIVQRARP